MVKLCYDKVYKNQRLQSTAKPQFIRIYVTCIWREFKIGRWTRWVSCCSIYKKAVESALVHTGFGKFCYPLAEPGGVPTTGLPLSCEAELRGVDVPGEEHSQAPGAPTWGLTRNAADSTGASSQQCSCSWSALKANIVCSGGKDLNSLLLSC